MTFSIVAHDAATGEVGLAIATARPAVGALCAFAEAGVGAVATQAIVNPRLAFATLEAARARVGASRALAIALGEDAGFQRRQVLAVLTDGDAAAHTGSEVGAWAGHLCGDGFAVGGNLLVSGGPLEAMQVAFRRASGSLGERLLVSLQAGDGAGGDRRGRQSAALYVVADEPWPTIDIRVDDHAAPIDELGRVFGLWQEHWGLYRTTGVFPPPAPPGPPSTAGTTV